MLTWLITTVESANLMLMGYHESQNLKKIQKNIKIIKNIKVHKQPRQIHIQVHLFFILKFVTIICFYRKRHNYGPIN